MGFATAISWTDHTFNLVWGCAKVSEACAHCYAEAWAARTGFAVWGAGGDRRTFGDKHWAEPLAWQARAKKEGRRRRVFCSSMADVFEDHPELARQRPRLWALIEATPDLDWLPLTKRPENIVRFAPESWARAWPKNVMPGTTVENQRRAEERLPPLLAVPAARRFVSCEPLLSAVDLRRWLLAADGNLAIHGVIAGGESGANARPSNPTWFSNLRDQTVSAGAIFHFKQWGEYHPKPDLIFPAGSPKLEELRNPKNAARCRVLVDGSTMYRVGKIAAGHLLEGQEWRSMPTSAAV